MSAAHVHAFAGKTAIVTGGTRGIGKALALELAARGANVFFNHRESDKEADQVIAQIERCGARGSHCKADLTKEGAARELVDAAVQAFGSLDILINNAGVAHLQRLGEQSSWAEADRLWAINTAGAIDMIRAASEVMSDGGRIITIGSVSGRIAGMPGAADYCGSKAAITGYSRGAARDLAPRNITVNVIESGMMDTEMAAGMPQADQDRILAGIPLGRFGKLSEIAGLLCFLAGPEAGYITGATLTIDGGYSA